MSKKDATGLSKSEMAFANDPLNADLPKSFEAIVNLDDRRYVGNVTDKEAFENHCLKKAMELYPEAFDD